MPQVKSLGLGHESHDIPVVATVVAEVWVKRPWLVVGSVEQLFVGWLQPYLVLVGEVDEPGHRPNGKWQHLISLEICDKMNG